MPGKVRVRNPFPSLGLVLLCAKGCRSQSRVYFLKVSSDQTSLWVWKRTRSGSRCRRFVKNILSNSRGVRCSLFLMWLH